MWETKKLSILQLFVIIFKIGKCFGSEFLSRNKTKEELSLETAYNVSQLLNNLLKNYDNTLRPNFGGPTTLIEVNMQVRSMGPISEIDMSYSMDCYFRQSWVDTRLAFTGYQKTLALSTQMLSGIWKPDTFMYNGKKSYLHTITTPNKFFRLFPDGRVLYSQRLTIRATCVMNLADFPMDKQKCPLKFGSFGYTAEDVAYQWTTGRGVNIANDMKLSQFDLIGTPTGNETTERNRGIHSTLIVSFHLQRHMGDFVIQVYGPCVLLVVISWVSFWLNREATPDRIALGVTTVLTMTFLGLEARKNLPKVPYPTALDYFVFIAFIYIFSTIVQFGLVHYFTKLGSGEHYLEELEDEPCPQHERRKLERYQAQKALADTKSLDTTHNDMVMAGDISYIGNHHIHMPGTEPYVLLSKSDDQLNYLNHQPYTRYYTMFKRYKESLNGGNGVAAKTIPEDKLEVQSKTDSEEECHCKRCIARALNNPEKSLNSVSRIDRISRIVFPTSFFVINLFYWYNYLDKADIFDLSVE